MQWMCSVFHCSSLQSVSAYMPTAYQAKLHIQHAHPLMGYISNGASAHQEGSPWYTRLSSENEVSMLPTVTSVFYINLVKLRGF